MTLSLLFSLFALYVAIAGAWRFWGYDLAWLWLPILCVVLVALAWVSIEEAWTAWRRRAASGRAAEEKARNAALVRMINDSAALRAAVGACVTHVDLGCDGAWLHRALDRHRAAKRHQFYQLYQPRGRSAGPRSCCVARWLRTLSASARRSPGAWPLSACAARGQSTPRSTSPPATTTAPI